MCVSIHEERRVMQICIGDTKPSQNSSSSHDSQNDFLYGCKRVADITYNNNNNSSSQADTFLLNRQNCRRSSHSSALLIQ